jgi:hypothetical protein
MTQTTIEHPLPTLTAQDLKGFDRRRVALIREMESYGWRGRRGAKNHMIMRAPDGETTTAVSRKVISRIDEHNVAREFRAWLRRQEQMSFPQADAMSVLIAFTVNHDPEPEAPTSAAIKKPLKRRSATAETVIEDAETVEDAPVDTAPPVVAVMRNAQYDCGLCEKPFATLQALSVHRARTHIRLACEVCDQLMAPGNLPRHLRKHVEVLGTHEQVMREVLQLRADVSRLRTEVAEWQHLAEATESEYVELQDGMRTLLGGC